MEELEYIINILVLGDNNVGKSSIIFELINMFDILTSKFDIYNNIKLKFYKNNITDDINQINIKLIIIDLTEFNTIKSINNYIDNNCNNYIILGNKSDDYANIEISKEDIIDKLNEISNNKQILVRYFDVNTKENKNLDLVINYIIGLYITENNIILSSIKSKKMCIIN